jgi:transposase
VNGARPGSGGLSRKAATSVLIASRPILAAIDAKVDMTLVELAEMLRDEHGAVFAASTIWRFLDRHAMTVKKNGTRQRAGAARRRRTAQNLGHRAA